MSNKVMLFKRQVKNPIARIAVGLIAVIISAVVLIVGGVGMVLLIILFTPECTFCTFAEAGHKS